VLLNIMFILILSPIWKDSGVTLKLMISPEKMPNLTFSIILSKSTPCVSLNSTHARAVKAAITVERDVIRVKI
jgi:hypothetical protein